MANITLPSTTFNPSAPVRKMALRNTLIEDMPQVSVRRAPPQKLQERPRIISPMSDDFPTPKGNTIYVPVLAVPESPASSDTQSDRDSLWSKRSSSSEFDEMYDLTDSESELQIKLSSSVKRRVGVGRSRYPSIIIPSPSQWPTVEKLKSSTTLSPPIQVALSPEVLSKLQQQSLRVPSTSTAPSLDGSMTSEELAGSSCPSTPDVEHQTAGENAWEGSVQLDPSAFSILKQINVEERYSQLDTVLEVPEEAVSEMREIVESPPLTGRFKLNTTDLKPASDEDADDELSALSVPSPGGFFASLDSTVARNTWSGVEPTPTTSTATEFYAVPFRSPQSSSLPTSTATSFYNLPWDRRPENPVERTVSVGSPQSERGPITARKIAFSPTETISEVDEIDETYNDTLQQTAAVNIDRTQLWLSAQGDYMKVVGSDDEVVESFRDVEDAVPKTPVDEASPLSTDSSPSKKSVRFADAIAQTEYVNAELSKRISPIHDGTFWDGWRHNKRSQRARDVFQHRQERAEAEHVRRTSCTKQHVEQLQGKFEITEASRPAPQRPVSNFLPVALEDEKKEMIATAERERQALEQMQSSSWHLSAQKELNGGCLLTSPIVQSFRGRQDVRILDLAGQVHCSWSWTVAAEHPDASVYTTVSSDAEAHVAESTLEGPNNHFVIAAPKPWELPFEDNYFDVISARNLYAHLKTLWPKGQAADEWDLTLRECQRVLKHGGYLEFDLMDAELVHADAASQAVGVEFAFNLKTRGYDPTSGKSFLPRLKRAGFGDIKRAWMVLPVADVVPRWTDSGKTPSSTSTIMPGNGREDYFGADFERYIGPNGEIEHYAPPLTGSTKDVRAMTGLVGARSWEQWMLKLNSEMGRSEERCLEGVAKALEEGGRGNAGWRCLVGWAKKSL